MAPDRNVVAVDLGLSAVDPRGVWDEVGQVVDAVEAELDALVTAVEDRVVARIQATHGTLSPALHEALRRALSAAVRDALARLRSQAELPQELPPDLIELARLCASSRGEASELADAWLVGQEVFWDRFQAAAEETLEHTALCWDVIKAARVRLRGHAANVSGLFRKVWESEAARAAGTREDRHRTEQELLLVEGPDGAVWGWLGGTTRMSDNDLDALVEWQRSRDGEVAFGEPAVGIAGFAASHHQALEARAIAAATNQSAVRFADLRLLIALLRDSDLAKSFVERELGELNDPSERMRELRETLRVYLEHGQSVSAAAALRRRDRKTIERQLRSAELIINHRVSDRCDELLIGLRLADILRHRS